MMFWDSSALVPLLVRESTTESAEEALRGDAEMVVWWGTVLECRSAISRTLREGRLDDRSADRALGVLRLLADAWSEVLPGERVRSVAGRILMTHPLRAADALQLAAAVVWADGDGPGCAFVCRDTRLRSAARAEGFTVMPSGV
jgi:predicted nucleic acid-binding protein